MKNLLFTALLTVSIISLRAQKQADQWYFGITAGINFSTGIPFAVQGTLNSTEGTTVSSDSSGNLNFYSDGVTVWNKTGIAMPNGTGLFGNVSTTVSALAVPHPGNSSLHYLFTLDEATGTHGFNYSIVDMSLQLGNGDVTLKNIPIQSNVTEKMAAVQQLGTNNTWVTVHEWGTDAFYSYLVTPAGFTSIPVISNAGMVHTADPLEQNKYGQMKFNTCGTKLAQAIGYTDTVQVLDFDPATGIFSNPITLPLGDHAYGVEFSQEGTMLYATRYNTGIGYAELLQYDLTSWSEPVINASMNIISSNTSGTNFYYALQLATNKNIYACISWSQYLGVISNPEIYGTGCNFNPQGFDLDPASIGASAALGLPAFVQSYFRGEVICNFPIGMNEIHDMNFTISPAISADGFMLQGDVTGKNPILNIYDAAGRVVNSNETVSENGFIFGKGLLPGFYLANISGTGYSKTFRIAKL